jgi:hypothetical protein
MQWTNRNTRIKVAIFSEAVAAEVAVLVAVF